MKQYIYFEDKTEYIINDDQVESYPIGKLMFSLLDVDWTALASQAEQLLKNKEGKPYFLVAAFYQEHCKMLQAVHPLLYQLVDAHLTKVIEDAHEKELPVAHDFALRLFRHYPNPPMPANLVNEFLNGNSLLPAVPDWPLVNVSVSFMNEIAKLYQVLAKYSEDLASMIEFAFDDAGKYASLSAKQGFYLMQISKYAPFEGSKALYESIGIERRILDHTELDYERYEEITPDLIREVENYDLNAYTFFHSIDIRALVFLEYEFMCTHNLTIRKCENCGRYFLPFSKVSLFCDRPVEGTDKTCKDIGAMIKYNEKVNADQAKKLFRRINNTYQMRCKRAPKVYPHAKYEDWRDKARTLLKEVEKGALSVSEFEAQINLPEPKQ